MQPFYEILQGQNVYAVKMICSFAHVNTNHFIYMDTAKGDEGDGVEITRFYPFRDKN